MVERAIGIVGARALPRDFSEQISGIVSYLLQRGYQIHTGGAVGADEFALQAVISQRSIERCVIFSAWTSVDGFPRSVIRYIDYFVSRGGRVDWGLVAPHSSRGHVITGLLARNTRLVRASFGIVAFMFGDSSGTRRTVLEAIRQRLRVVVFLCGGGAVLPELTSGRWVQLRCGIWEGAFMFRS